MKKKVTLSIEGRVYDLFKKYCDENAIMLSKKIELVMADILKNADTQINKDKKRKNE